MSSGGPTPSPRAGGRRCRRRPRARRTSSSCCSTTSATPSSAATAPTSPRRASTGSPATGHRYSNFHTTALCSPTRACLLTGRNHHSQRHGPHRRVRGRLPRLQRHDPARERLPLGDPRAQRLRHLRGRQVAPHAGHRDDDGQPARQVAARPRASSASTGSWAARPTSTTPSSCTTTTTSSRRARRRRATTSPRTWPTRRSCS